MKEERLLFFGTEESQELSFEIKENCLFRYGDVEVQTVDGVPVSHVSGLRISARQGSVRFLEMPLVGQMLFNGGAGPRCADRYRAALNGETVTVVLSGKPNEYERVVVAIYFDVYPSERAENASRQHTVAVGEKRYTAKRSS